MGDNSKKPGIRFKGFTDDWEQRKLGELGTITTGNTPSTSIPDYYSDDGIVWVTPTDICENITFESARKLSDLGQQVGRVVPKKHYTRNLHCEYRKEHNAWKYGQFQSAD